MAYNTLGADAATRAYLLDAAREFRRLMCSTLLDDSQESAQFAFDQLSPRVDALADGRPCLIHRYELPDDHPQAPPHGHPCDLLELGADDVVRQRR